MRAALLWFLLATPALAQAPISVLGRETLVIEPPADSTHELHLTLAWLEGSGWSAARVAPLAAEAARVLAQCRVALTQVGLVRVGAPERYRDYATAPARELARELKLAKPTVYFVADTRQQPAFDAEAIGRGNSRGRPELADTVWLTRATRDPGIALAHELAHVLMNSGVHSTEERNLMRDETASGNERLSGEQCARLRESATENGLIRPR